MEKALWSRLESKVRQAATVIEDLRQENNELRERLARLDGKAESDESWSREKAEARERAESLIELLEGLLEGGSSDR